MFRFESLLSQVLQWTQFCALMTERAAIADVLFAGPRSACETGALLYMYSNREMIMLALRLPPEIEKRLDALAKKTGRSKSFYAREAILRHIEDLEDYHLARRRLARRASRVPLEALEQEIAKSR
jgi:RHH-type transcriptional regulator, rel operon repressor / antitoxin RelB